MLIAKFEVKLPQNGSCTDPHDAGNKRKNWSEVFWLIDFLSTVFTAYLHRTLQDCDWEESGRHRTEEQPVILVHAAAAHVTKSSSEVVLVGGGGGGGRNVNHKTAAFSDATEINSHQ